MNIYKSISVNLMQYCVTREMITVVNLILRIMDEENENITNVIKKNTMNMKEIVTKLESIIRSNVKFKKKRRSILRLNNIWETWKKKIN